MKQLNKKDLIKDYILKDKERFLLAEDISNHFKSITDDMLKALVDQVIKHVNSQKNINLQYPVSDQRGDYHVIEVKIAHGYSIEIHFSYYFKYTGIGIRSGNADFDKENQKQIQLRRLFEEKFSNCTINIWFISWIRDASDGVNMYIGDNYGDLFSVYQDKLENGPKMKKLCEDFDNIAGDTIVKIIEIIESVESES